MSSKLSKIQTERPLKIVGLVIDLHISMVCNKQNTQNKSELDNETNIVVQGATLG